MSGNTRNLALGSAWFLAGQLVVSTAQLGYTATTSRLVSSSGFGSYAVAIALSPLVMLITNIGLGNAAARMPIADRDVLRGLATVAWLTGVLAATSVFLTAHWWALLWGNAGAESPTRWTALIVLIAPIAGLLTGLARREGKLRSTALVSTVSNLAGMVAGIFAVRHVGTPSSLLTMSTCSLLLQVILIHLPLRRVIVPGKIGRGAWTHISFGKNVMLGNVLAYLSLGLPQMAVSRAVGVAAFGNWNRAAALTQVPLEFLQSAMIQALYPEFRHDIDRDDRAKRVWPDLMLLAAWLSVPASVVAAVLSPSIIGFLLGDGWDTAARLAPWLAISAGASTPTIILGVALEATGRFRWIWSSLAATLLLAVVVAGATFAFDSLVPAVVGLLLAPLLRHAMQLRLAAQSRLIDLDRVLRGYAEVSAASLVLGVLLAALVVLLKSELAWEIRTFVPAVMASTLAFALRVNFYRLPPVVIARRHHILQRST